MEKIKYIYTYEWKIETNDVVKYLFGDIKRQNFIKYLLTQIDKPRILTKNIKEIVELALSELEIDLTNVEIIDPFDTNNLSYDKLFLFRTNINDNSKTYILFDDFDATNWMNVNNMKDQVYNFRKNIANDKNSKYIIYNIDPSTGITPETFFEILPNLGENYYKSNNP